jgi:hypothetical protein
VKCKKQVKAQKKFKGRPYTSYNLNIFTKELNLENVSSSYQNDFKQILISTGRYNRNKFSLCLRRLEIILTTHYS